MKKALIVVGLVVVLAVILIANVDLRQEVDYSQATLVFEKSSGWGPCESGDECTQHIYLYSNGALKVEGKNAMEKNIGMENFEKFMEVVRDSGVIGKKCEFVEVMDYSATYKIYLDNVTTTIIFPGCDAELSRLDSFLYPFIK